MKYQFIEVPANERSLYTRKPVFGIGINDASYMVTLKVDGKRLTCPYYKKWHNMIRRCYWIKSHKYQPTYKNCKICKEWIYFTKFREWMMLQDWENKDLDKDLKILGNNTYSPENCLFISESLNNLLCNSLSIRGDLPQGVVFHKKAKKFIAQIKLNGKVKYLGLYETQDQAKFVYIKSKNEEILRQSNLPENKEIKQYFNQHLIK